MILFALYSLLVLVTGILLGVMFAAGMMER
jgi:hypothetical protein